MSVANEQVDTASVSTSNQGGSVSPRSPLNAVTLSLLMTGLGHVYCGELVIGLVWAAVGVLSGVISLWTLATQDGGLLLSSLPMSFVSIAAATHAWSLARHCPRDYRLRSYNRWYVYGLLLLISSFGSIGHGLIVQSKYVEAFVTVSDDMRPTLQAGDRFLVDKTAYNDAKVEVDDLLVFKCPAEPKRTFIKRVVALAGDQVEIRDGLLRVNDQPVGAGMSEVDDFGPETVPPYNCFVLGDERKKSRDSRHFGPVPYAGVKGRATFVFWPQRSWSRFGRLQ